MLTRGGNCPLAAIYLYKPWQPQPKDATDENFDAIRQVDSEEISFECVDARRQRTTAHPISSTGAFGSEELKKHNKTHTHTHKTCNGLYA